MAAHSAALPWARPHRRPAAQQAVCSGPGGAGNGAGMGQKPGIRFKGQNISLP